MVERRVDRSSGSVPRPQSAPPASVPLRRTTERVAPLTPNRGELPGWIWAGLGCLSVLAAGFAVMFVVVNPSAAPLPTAAVTAMPAPAPDPAPEPANNIRVVPLAAPAPSAPPPQAHRPKSTRPAPPRAVRVARSPSAVHAAQKAASSEEETEVDEEELLKPAKARTAAKTRPSAAAQGDEEEASETSATD